MQYKQFTLDLFQEQAVKSLEKNHSVVVSAATGTGKTLIADYAINKYINEGKKVIYTAPIKALSNQKYRDFKKEYGEEKVGIMTGDVVINSSAPILIMTTEIYRNMLLEKDSEVKEVSYVVFDEIHYLSDIERGTVWEESIIFSPPHVRFLCLSATIPNSQEFADWIKTTKEHFVDVVSYEKRAVPLKHHVYDDFLGVTDLKELEDHMKIPVERSRDRNKKWKKERLNSKIHLDLISDIRDKLPTIFFSFNRKDCEIKARDAGRAFNFCTNEEKTRIIQLTNKIIPQEYRNLESVRNIKQVLSKGIAYHHAGLLPFIKEAVEELFGEGLIKILYATETFAVGINMPAKSVCFGSLEKYDGFNFRYLYSKEYFQLAGRAGRRGIDKEGNVYAIIDRNYTDIKKVERITSKDIEPIISRFQLTYNTVLHMMHSHDEKEIDKILKMNFDYFQKKRQGQDIRLNVRFYNRVDILKKRDYIDQNNLLTEKGMFTLHIYFYELIIPEIFCTNTYKNLSDDELLVLLTAIIYEPKLKDHFSIKRTDHFYIGLLKKIEHNQYLTKNLNKKVIQRMINLITLWANGHEFSELLQTTSLEEGDIIRLIRRLIDVLRQIRRATTDEQLKERIQWNIERLDRDVVSVMF